MMPVSRISSYIDVLLYYLMHFGILTVEMLQALRVYPSIQNLHRALNKLFERGIVERFRYNLGEACPPKYIYYLAKGYCREHKIRFRDYSDIAIKHPLGINSSLIKLIAGSYDSGYEVLAFPEHSQHGFNGFKSGRELCSLSYEGVALIPDSLLCLVNNSTIAKALLFVEYDLDTEAIREIVKKIESYNFMFDNWKQISEKFDHYFDNMFNGFRVLFVVSNTVRMYEILDICLKINAEYVYIAKETDFKDYSLTKPIWETPKGMRGLVNAK